MVNGWKVATIILILTNVLTILFLGWAWSYGTELINNENECGVNICRDYDSYYYDDYDNICYCYKNQEIVYQEFIGKGYTE